MRGGRGKETDLPIFLCTYILGMLFGQLPLLEVNGEVVCQSRAAAGYLARTFGELQINTEVND